MTRNWSQNLDADVLVQLDLSAAFETIDRK